MDLARGDAWEGADRTDQPEHIKSVKIRFESHSSQGWIEHELAGPVITRNSHAEYPATHGLCFNIVDRQMLAEASEKSSRTIDFNRFCCEFGPSLLVVTNISKFLELTIGAIKGAFPEEIERSSQGPVEYVEDSHHGRYSIYCKPARFGWQKEFRVMLYSPRSSGNPLLLQYASLSAIWSQVQRLFRTNLESQGSPFPQNIKPQRLPKWPFPASVASFGCCRNLDIIS